MNRTKKIEAVFFVIRDLLAIGIALLISFLLIFAVSEDAFGSLKLFLVGPLQTVSRMGYIVEKMIPLLFTGVGVSLMFRCRQVNMGSEGAFYLAGVACTAAAVNFALPGGIHPIVCILIGGVVGALVCGLTAVMHTKFHSLTIVTSLMINYVCLYLGQYFINHQLWDVTTGYQASFKFAETALLPKLFSRTNIHAGISLAIAVVIFGHILLEKSTFGYKLKLVGINPEFSRYSGINVTAVIIGVCIFGESFSLQLAIGILAILAGVTIIIARKK